MSIPAVAATAHARYQIIGPAEPLPVITAILTALDALLGGRLENGKHPTLSLFFKQE